MSIVCPACLGSFETAAPECQTTRCPLCQAEFLPAPLASAVTRAGGPGGSLAAAAALPQEEALSSSRALPETDSLPRTGVDSTQDVVAVAAPRRPDLLVPGYEMLGELGRGGMGVVLKARHIALKRIVAIKMIRSATLAGQDEVSRFRAEAEAVASLQHPNIVQIYEIGECEGLPYLSLEYLDGGSLADYLGTTPLPPTDAARLVETVARAIHHAHQRGVVHRDLKPANILLVRVESTVGEPGMDPVSEGSRPDSARIPVAALHLKVSDFGLAKLAGQDSGQTHTGQVLGTPSYMAPEQAEGKRDIGPLTDVYALGAILYRCLTGRPPFKGATSRETLDLVCRTEAVPPIQLQPRIPRDLNTICLTCLNKDPGQRYPSALALAQDLRRFLVGEPIRARPIGPIGRTVKWARRRPAIASFLAVLALLLATAGTAVTVQWRRAESAAEQAREEAERANLARVQAEEAEEKARLASQREAEQRSVAEFRRRAAEQAELQARRTLTSSRIAQAQTALQEGNLQLARDLLDRCAPEARFWDWYFARRQAAGGSIRLHDLGGSVALSADGHFLAGAKGAEVVLLDVRANLQRRTLSGHRDGVTCLAFDPASKVLVSSGRDGQVLLWNTGSGQLMARYLAHSGAVDALAIHPDGQWAASAGSDGIRVWQIASQQTVLTFPGPFQPARGLAFSPDGKHLAWCSRVPLLRTDTKRGGRRLWEMPAGTEVRLPARWRDQSSGALAFRGDGRFLAFAEGVKVVLLDTNTLREAGTLEGHRASLISLAASPDGQQWASADLDGTVRLWDAHTRKVQEAITVARKADYRLAFSGNGLFLAGTAGDEEERRIDLWPTRGGASCLTLAFPDHLPVFVAFRPDGQQLASSGEGSTLIWDTRTGALLRQINSGIGALAWSPDGQWLVTGGAARPDGSDPGVTVWNPETGQSKLVLRGARGAVGALAFSPDGTRLAAGCGTITQGWLALWEVPSGKLLWCIRAGSNLVGRIAWTADGKRILSCSLIDRFATSRDATTGQLIDTMAPHLSLTGALAASPDGKYLATGGSPRQKDGWGEVKLWEPHTGRETRVLRGHANNVWGLAWSRDSQRLASASIDGTFKVWDVANGQDVFTIRLENRQGLLGLAFSPAGHHLAVASSDGMVRLYDGTPLGERIVVKLQPTSSNWIAFDPQDRWVARLHEDGLLEVRHPRTGRLLWTLSASQRAAPRVALHLEQGRLVHAQANTLVEVDVLTGKTRRTYPCGSGQVWRLAYSRDGTSLAAVRSGTRDRPDAVQVQVWDTATGNSRLTFTPPAPASARVLEFHHDLTQVAMPQPRAVEQGAAVLSGWRRWDLRSAKELKPTRRFELAREVTWQPAGRWSSLALAPTPEEYHTAEVLRVEDAPDAQEIHRWTARLRPTTLSHRVEAGRAFVQQRWAAATFHLERVRGGEVNQVVDQELDYHLANAIHNLGNYMVNEDRLDLGIAGYRRSLPYYERLVKAYPAMHHFQRDLGNTLVNLGYTLSEIGQHAEAQQHLRRGIRVLDDVVHQQPGIADYRALAIYARGRLASALGSAGRHGDAERLFRQVIDRGKRFVADHPGNQIGQYNLSAILHNFAALLDRQERQKEAAEYYHQARSLLDTLAKRDPFTTWIQRDLGNTLILQSKVLATLGRQEEAEAAIRRSVELFRQLARNAENPQPFHLLLVHALDKQGYVLQRSSNPRQAEDAYEAAIEQARRLAAEAPEVPRYRFELSAVLHNHGMFLLRHADRPRAAEGVFRGAERLLAALVEERRGLTIYRRDLANTRLHLGKALVALGKVGDAANSFRLAEAGWRDLFRTYPDEGDHELTLLWVRGEIALLIGNPDEAARLAERMVGHHRADRTSHVIAAGLLARSALASKEKPTREARVGRAIALLRLAIQKGLPQPKDLHRDRDLEALRSHPEFQRLIIERSADQP